MAFCKKCCCCMCCPFCFLLGTLKAFALLGAFIALCVALAFGPAPLDLADEVADLCEAVAWFRDTDLSYTVASKENLAYWVKGCRAAFLELEPEAQEILRQIQKTGRHRSEEMLMESGIDDRSRGWKNATLHAEAAGQLKEADAPPFVELSEIRKAFEDARVVRFDARQLLPKHMFNVTLEDIQNWHPDTINETILYGTFGGGGLCRMIFLGRVTNAYPIIGRTLLFSALREFLMAFQGALCGLRPLPYWIANPEKRHRLSTANINLKRLPQLDEGLDVPAKLGLSSEVAGMLGLLWMGMVDRGMARSSLHTDVQDNILMELVSETEVTVVPREIFWGKNDLAEVTGSYYRVNLKPGEGIAIPSNFLHSVHHLHLDRLGVNYFFEPKFGQMQWPNSTGNFYAENAKGNQEHLAMRALWFKSANVVWERYHRGVSMHGWKMEIL